MKKNFVRMIQAMLAAMLVFSLAACGSTGGDTGSNGSGLKNDVQDQLDNGDVKFFLWSEPSIEDKDFFASFEEKYGGTVSYEVTTWGQMEAKILSAIAADDSPDLIWTHDGNFIKNAITGVIAPIDDLINLNDSLWDPMSKRMTWNKKHYLAIPNGSVSEVLIYYNKTMFENNGVKTPTEYYKEGQWTYDNFSKCAIALTKDTNGDGKVDQYGWSSWRMFDFAFANGGSIVEKNAEDNNVKISLNSEEMKYGLQFVKDAYQKYKYAKPDGNVSFQTDLQSGKVAMVSENAFIGSLCGKMTDKWDIVPFPTAPKNTEKKNLVTALGWGLAANAPNAKGAVAYMKMFADYKIKTEKKTLSKYFTEEQLKIIYDARKNPFYPRIDTNFGVWEKTQNNFMFGIVGTEDVSKSIAKWEPILQTQIDNTLAQQGE